MHLRRVKTQFHHCTSGSSRAHQSTPYSNTSLISKELFCVFTNVRLYSWATQTNSCRTWVHTHAGRPIYTRPVFPFVPLLRIYFSPTTLCEDAWASEIKFLQTKKLWRLDVCMTETSSLTHSSPIPLQLCGMTGSIKLSGFSKNWVLGSILS